MDHLTIEQLSSRAGIPTTTIRMYQARGLLPGPTRRGRVGYYGRGHLARLRLIGRLQQQGFSLAAVKQLVDDWESGRTLDDVLGLERRLPGLLEQQPPMLLDPPELASRFPDGTLSPEVMARAVALALVRLSDDGRVVVEQPAFLEVGSALVALGLPVDEVLDEYEALGEVLDGVATRFVDVFDRYVWQAFAEAGMPDDRLAEVTATLDRLAGLACDVVEGALRSALRRAAEQFVADRAAELSGKVGSESAPA